MTTKKSVPTASMADLMLRADAPVPPPVADPAGYVQFANRITRANKEQLKRLAYWRREKEQDLLDAALTAYFATQDPQDLRPVPVKK